ncbi:MAG: DUF2911 domain-containing protein [Cyclobacteriaceae bacterium]|nr:DUF2911 domain-containing protein [Cyclobacteriaceae bacterium]
MKQFFTFLLFLLTVSSFAQEALKLRPSPLAVVSTHYKDTYLKITYSQPQKHNREIFGKLVPFNEVWRTGANEATEITLTRDLKINGLDLKAGTYSVFSIPKENSWTIILNSDLGLWGSYNYTTKSDVIRFDVPTQPITDIVYDAFTITINQRNDKAELIMSWDKTKVVIPVQFLEPKI